MQVLPPVLNLLPLSAASKCLPTDCGTPTFWANFGLWATASMNPCCFFDVLGILTL